jgi:hypothetical protein
LHTTRNIGLVKARVQTGCHRRFVRGDAVRHDALYDRGEACRPLGDEA